MIWFGGSFWKLYQERMKIIAKRGDAYLVSLEMGNLGCMFNLGNMNRSLLMDIDYFLARGYWTEVRKLPDFDLERIFESEPKEFYDDELY